MQVENKNKLNKFLMIHRPQNIIGSLRIQNIHGSIKLLFSFQNWCYKSIALNFLCLIFDIFSFFIWFSMVIAFPTIWIAKYVAISHISIKFPLLFPNTFMSKTERQLSKSQYLTHNNLQNTTIEAQRLKVTKLKEQ